MRKAEIKELARRIIAGFPTPPGDAEERGGPLALVVAGQHGSGMFRIAAGLQGRYFGGAAAAAVCAEDFRHFHRPEGLPENPNDAGADGREGLKDARALERGYLKALMAAGADILWFARTDNGSAVPEILRIMKKAGYGVEAVMVAVPGKISAARAVFEHEWLMQARGFAPMPSWGLHAASLQLIGPISLEIERQRLASRIRVAGWRAAAAGN